MEMGLSSLLADLPDTDALRRFTCVRDLSRTYDFHQTLGRPRALVTSVSGSLHQGPGIGFRYMMGLPPV